MTYTVNIYFSPFWRLRSLGSDLVSGEDLFSDLQIAAFSLCPHKAEGVREFSGEGCGRGIVLL